jgi:hypothetical protein
MIRFGSVAESIAANEASTAGGAQIGSVTEAIGAAASQGVSLVRLGAVAESTTAQDGTTSQAALVGALSNAMLPSDAVQRAPGVNVASVSESTSPSLSFTQAYDESLSETCAAGSLEGVSNVAVAARAETLTGAAAQAGARVMELSVSEAGRPISYVLAPGDLLASVSEAIQPKMEIFETMPGAITSQATGYQSGTVGQPFVAPVSAGLLAA